MFFNRIVWFIFAGVLLITEISQAQISQGGSPMKTSGLKSSRNPIVEMPPVNNLSILENEAEINSLENQLKPFRFAHPFEVNLTPENSGEWLQGEDGFIVWKLTIRSAGAKSLNLIFEDFELQEKERLFMYNTNEDYILGAYTSLNNATFRKFAVSPVLGDEITVQYEIPAENFQNKHFTITRVNHDYVGILKSGGRRPLGKTANPCNIDINCDYWESWSELKNSVVRIIINKTNSSEICTGVLVNNTAENQKPYILTAAHCFDKWSYPEISVFSFNYESPFCAPLDGDPSNSISGAIMKAQSDSADFALVELSRIPPPDFRPFYAGWNRSTELNDSSISIHHPQGDIKKLSFDKDIPAISSFESGYKKNGFLKILKWEKGLTENGSSGGPLFDSKKHVIGTLTGGPPATCNNALNDEFERFATSWEHKPDSTKQLKYWLDPTKSGVKVLEGRQFYEGEELCGAFTNLNDNDEYSMVPLLKSGKFAGYWGGSNSANITEIMEQFSINGNETLSGVSFGVGKFNSKVTSNNSEITIKVYNGNTLPVGPPIYSQVVKTSGLARDAMNFIGFTENVKPDNTFFVGFELSKIQALDSFAVYQSLRTASDVNTFYFRQNNVWINFKEANPEKKAMSNIFELVACNIDDFNTDTPLVNNPHDILVFPNPSNSKVTVEAGQNISENQITVFNLLGQKIEVKITGITQKKVDIDLTGNVPGVYFVRFDSGEDVISKKISFVPW